jgi:CheY-like chemotaxis protein
MAKKVLIIDDNTDNILVLKDRLEFEGYTVDSAPDGESGFVKAQDFVPDVILLDIMMPGKDGFTVFRELKLSEITRAIPVFFFSAKMIGDIPLPEDMKKNVVFLSKPVSPETVLAAIRKYVKE